MGEVVELVKVFVLIVVGTFLVFSVKFLAEEFGRAEK